MTLWRIVELLFGLALLAAVCLAYQYVFFGPGVEHKWRAPLEDTAVAVLVALGVGVLAGGCFYLLFR